MKRPDLHAVGIGAVFVIVLTLLIVLVLTTGRTQ